MIDPEFENHNSQCQSHAVLSQAIYNTDKKNQELEKSMIELKGDVSHIKDRLDKGMAPTLEKLGESQEKLKDSQNETNELLKSHILPMVKDNKEWIVYVKKAFIQIGVWTGVLSIVSIGMFIFLKNFLNMDIPVGLLK